MSQSLPQTSTTAAEPLPAALRGQFSTALEGLAWPAFATGRPAVLLALLAQLEWTQWLPAPALRRLQLSQLRLLLNHARASVPFYRDRLPTLGTELDEATWLAVPILRRPEIQAAGDELRSGALPASHGGIDEIFTSGSTGKPVRVLRSEAWNLFWRAQTLRDHFWHRRDLGGLLAVIRNSTKGEALYPEGERMASWSGAYRRLLKTGPAVSLNILSTTAEKAEWLQRQQPDFLLTHPTVDYDVAAHCLEQGIVLPKLKQVITISENLRPGVRDMVRSAWGIGIADLYSTRETGYIALQCPDHEHYHMQSEGMMVELLDEAGRPVGPGEIGRVVLTPLHNFAMPLIRYEIGDYARLGPPCACGRGLPVLSDIQGREQGMLTLPNGERRWPLLSSKDIGAILQLAPVRQYQFVQRSLTLLEMKLAVARPLSPGEAQALIGWAKGKFGREFEVALSFHEELPRTAAGKFHDFLSDLPARPAP